jgi:hypothetical protein
MEVEQENARLFAIARSLPAVASDKQDMTTYSQLFAMRCVS